MNTGAFQERLRLRNAGGVEHGSSLMFQDESDHIAQIVVVVNHQDRKAGACGSRLFVRKHAAHRGNGGASPKRAESTPKRRLKPNSVWLAFPRFGMNHCPVTARL
jgi:hypothetical protein